MVGGIATAAAVRTWPFRVYSFPAAVMPLKDFIAQYVEPVSLNVHGMLFSVGDLVRIGAKKNLYRVTSVAGHQIALSLENKDWDLDCFIKQGAPCGLLEA